MKENTVTREHIESILKKSEFICETHFDKCTVLTCRLPNGFTITESSACVDPKNYSKTIGREACMNQIRNKLWELEGYLLQNKLYEKKQADEEKTMTFMELMKVMKEGTKAKRKSWRDNFFIEYATGKLFIIRFSTNSGKCYAPYTSYPDDIYATDWIIIEQ